MEGENIDEFRTMLQHELITACTTIASNKLSSSLLCTVLDRKEEKEEEDDEEENKSHEVCDRILNKNFSRTCHSSEHPGRTMSRRQKTNKYSLTSSTAPTVAGGPATGFPKKQTRSLFQFNRMPRAGFVGLKNQGATCYLNSLLQSLFMIPEFRRGLFTLSDADFGMTLTTFPVEEISEENKSGNIIPYELQHLFIQLQTSDQKCISTKRVTDSFGWKDNQAMQQQDVSELNRILITALERCLRKTPAGNLIPSLYKGMLSYETTCSKCSYVSRREEEFYDIVLGLENVNSISQSLDLFMAPEALTGSNQYRCSMCGIKVDAERRTRITKLPPVMTFCLNRFKYDWSRGVRNKVNSLFEFPVELDFQPYFHVESKTEQGQLLAYDLASVIIHGGNANSGHYTAYIRDFIGEGSWKELFHKKGDNEEKSVKNNRSNSEAILPSFETNVPWDFDNPKNNSPVVSILRDLLLPPHKAEILLDDIGSVLSEVLKKSWKKNFKTQHGPIDAFVRGHSSVFRVKDNFVRLQPSAISPPSSTDAKSILAVNVPTPQSAQHEEGWFFFNDSNVTAISHNLLKSQFGDKGANGKNSSDRSESAYMLVYRKRPENSTANSYVELPEYVSHIMRQQEAQALEKKRLDAVTQDSATVQVTRFFSPCALRASSKPTVFIFTLRKSWTLSQLRNELILQSDSMENCCISFISESGVHNSRNTYLTTFHKPEDSEQTLISLGFQKGRTEIIIEDSVGGELAAAEEKRRRGTIEILVIDCSRNLSKAEASKLRFWIHPSATLAAFKEHVISRLFPDQSSDLTDKKFQTVCQSRRFQLPSGLPLLFAEEFSSFEDLNLLQNVVLVLESHPALCEEELYVRCKFVEGKEEREGGVVVHSSATVAQLKDLLIAALAREWDLSLRHKFVLRRTQKKNKSELSPETQTIKELQLSAGSAGSEFRLSAVHGVLLSLERVGSIEISQGVPVIPGTLSLDFLVRTPQTLQDSGNSLVGSAQLIGEIKSKPLCPFRVAVSELQNTLRLNVDPNSTVEEAAEALAALPSFQSICFAMGNTGVSPGRIRISLMNPETKQPTTIMRSRNKTWKQLKIVTETQFIVEVLAAAPDADDTANDAVTVFIARRHYAKLLEHSGKITTNEEKAKDSINAKVSIAQYEGFYQTYIETIFRKKDVTNFGNLRAKLVALTGIAAADMEVAVYLADSFRWQRLKNDAPNPKKRGKAKKKRRNAHQSKASGSFIEKFKDRTVLGVIDRVDWTGMGPDHEDVNWDDFKSPFDRFMASNTVHDQYCKVNEKRREPSDLYIDIGLFDESSDSD